MIITILHHVSKVEFILLPQYRFASRSQLAFTPSYDTVTSWDAMVNLVQSSPEARAYTVTNPFRSFAPVRTDGQIRVYVRGLSSIIILHFF